MAIIGRHQAVAQLFGRFALSGPLALVAWGAIHIAYLVGWGSRIETLARWGWTLLARKRRERLISVAGHGRSVPRMHERDPAVPASIEGRHPGLENGGTGLL